MKYLLFKVIQKNKLIQFPPFSHFYAKMSDFRAVGLSIHVRTRMKYHTSRVPGNAHALKARIVSKCPTTPIIPMLKPCAISFALIWGKVSLGLQFISHWCRNREGLMLLVVFVAKIDMIM